MMDLDGIAVDNLKPLMNLDLYSQNLKNFPDKDGFLLIVWSR
jgi:hypothetical protein